MLNRLATRLLSATPEGLSRSFRRVGWVGFWLQIVLGTVPVLLLIYVLFFCRSAAVQRGGLGVADYLGLAGFAVLVFTVLWSFRYTRLSGRLSDEQRRPGVESLTQVLTTGVVASLLGITISMLLMIFKSARLLIVFLTAPQGGVPIVQTATYDPTTWVSAMDMAALLSNLLLLAAELFVLTSTLWLLFRVQLSHKALGKG